METKITKWGNSFAIRLPREAALQLLKIGERVRIHSDRKKIVIQAVPQKDGALREMVDQIRDENKHGVMLLKDRPRGKEVW